MEWFEAVLLGLIQGLTEFLPVSSSGHLEIGKHLLGIETSDDLLFTTMVHAATVLSTIVVFRKQIWDLLRGFFCGLKGIKVEKAADGRFSLVCNDQTDYLLKILVSIIPVFVVGVFSILGLFYGVQIDALFVTALLTVIGFSVHDTIVVFDRVRENLKYYAKKMTFGEIMNASINQTLTRSINTSVTTLITLAALYFFGGVTTKDFVLAMILGIAIGTYSSIFFCSSLVEIWEDKK